MTTQIDGLDYDHAAVSWGEELLFPSTRNFAQSAHRIFNRYPARSISLVPRAILRSVNPASRYGVRVLDPFMGSGTTAVEATLAGFEPFGVEIDPFARLVTDVRIRHYGSAVFDELEARFTKIVLRWDQFPVDYSNAPKLNNVEYWFEREQFEDLLKLKNAIYDISDDDHSILDFFRVVFADIVRPCSRAERQTLKPYISKRHPKVPANVLDTFKKSFQIHLSAAKEFHMIAPNVRPDRISWVGFDGTSFACSDSINVAITSPPYINALDYVRCIKLESSWVDCGDDQKFLSIRQSQVGDNSRRRDRVATPVDEFVGPIAEGIGQSDQLRAQTTLAYFDDMFSNLCCTYEALVEGGEYHVIVGDSVIRGVYVPTHQLISTLGESIGFRLTQRYKYKIRDHRTSIPRKGMGGKIEYEHVISLKKV